MGRTSMLTGLALAVLVSTAVSAAPTAIDGGAVASSPAVRGEAFQVGDDPVEPQPLTARYRITLSIEWSPQTHPATIPPVGRSPHVSPPVVATHRAADDMFRLGALASPGVEAMAETGSTSALVGEMQANANVATVDVGSSIYGAGSRSFDVELRQDVSRVSLVTMLAPSPDWFVGVNSLPVFVDGVWESVVSADLEAYDAGTDSAPGFVHSNTDTDPAQPISGPVDTEFARADDEGRFGFVTITRLS
ncbi:spondin domain-containing protein [Ilumatobacter coccineus]|nr:spondin domain-containing protein [Ilumatobacter coccineus]